jgi:fibronectin type 3 domain-containing protein
VTLTQQGVWYDMTLNWTPTTGATSYRVERKNTTDPVTSFIQIATTTAPSYIDQDQASPFSLDYRVIAINASAGTESDPSNVVTATAGPHTTPPTISAVAASPGQTTCAITWTTDEPATSAVSYRTGTNPWTTTPVNSSLVTDHSMNLSGLTAGTTYDFYVISADGVGNTSQSAVQQFTTQTAPTPPPPPSNLRVVKVFGGNKIELGWDAAPTATGYRLYSRDLLAPGGPGPWILLSDQTATSYTDDRYGPQGAHSFEYYVTAYNAQGESGESNHVIYSEST